MPRPRCPLRGPHSEPRPPAPGIRAPRPRLCPPLASSGRYSTTLSMRKSYSTGSGPAKLSMPRGYTTGSGPAPHGACAEATSRDPFTRLESWSRWVTSARPGVLSSGLTCSEHAQRLQEGTLGPTCPLLASSPAPQDLQGANRRPET